ISDAVAEAAQGAEQADPMTSLIFFGGMILIFYFILIRPQSKRAKEHRELVAGISKGDEVVTNGGILGKITDVSEQYVTLEVADNVEMKIQKSAVATVLPKGSLKAALKD
ncbi:MAG: preprotein translocase subunit YajC, partial [Gammaproteobacteria bacterium]|nr:preprotein translocase subunit YajC [Gammaproteobacteria bacterium]